MKTFSSALGLATLLATTLGPVQAINIQQEEEEEPVRITIPELEVYELYGCNSLEEIPCYLRRPFCTIDSRG